MYSGCRNAEPLREGSRSRYRRFFVLNLEPRSTARPDIWPEGSTLQKKLWGTTKDIKGQYTADEAVGNH